MTIARTQRAHRLTETVYLVPVTPSPSFLGDAAGKFHDEIEFDESWEGRFVPLYERISSFSDGRTDGQKGKEVGSRNRMQGDLSDYACNLLEPVVWPSPFRSRRITIHARTHTVRGPDPLFFTSNVLGFGSFLALWPSDRFLFSFSIFLSLSLSLETKRPRDERNVTGQTRAWPTFLVSPRVQLSRSDACVITRVLTRIASHATLDFLFL